MSNNGNRGILGGSQSLTGNTSGKGELAGGVSAVQRVAGNANKTTVIHGQTPYIKDGNWWIGAVDTGVRAEGIDGYSPSITVTDIEGGHRVTITDKNGTNSYDIVGGSGGGVTLRNGHLTVYADRWEGEASPYTQIVTVDGVTKYTQVDIKPTAEQYKLMKTEKTSFLAKNRGGVVTVEAEAVTPPSHDYTFQVTLSEVSI